MGVISEENIDKDNKIDKDNNPGKNSDIKSRIKAYFDAKKHYWHVAVYFVLYMAVFQKLELEFDTIDNVNIIYCPIDDYIPVVPFFSVFYVSWFGFMVLLTAYFAFLNKNVAEYNRYIWSLFSGMTVFLMISAVWPNGLDLRPATLDGEGIFVKLVNIVWNCDTPTNVFPSVHVFNSMTVAFAVSNCEALKKHKIFQGFILIWVFLIIASTMLIKQHSVIDVVVGLIFSILVYWIFYGKHEGEQKRV